MARTIAFGTRAVVEASLKGKRTCLFAYGQTGSGKTFSMYGAEGGKNPSKVC